ncbi:winged helix-turn-helix domain-containing protein [Nitrospira sp. Nam74]
MTAREFELLWDLASMIGHVVTRESLMTTVWQQEVHVSRTIDSHIASLLPSSSPLYTPYTPTVCQAHWNLRTSCVVPP